MKKYKTKEIAQGKVFEELREITIGGGIEYWYGKPKMFAFRTGYFHEHATKGNRKFFTFGIGLKYKVFGLDFSYLVPIDPRSPLEDTFRFSPLFNFAQILPKLKPQEFLSQ